MTARGPRRRRRRAVLDRPGADADPGDAGPPRAGDHPRSCRATTGSCAATSRPRRAARSSAGWRHGTTARLGTAAIADEIAARDRAHGAIDHPAGPQVERVRARTVREPAPLLFDLTSLQRTANRRFGFSAARTLELAQALYERHKLLTYPRTDSRHLTGDVVPELPALFAALAEVPDYAPFAAPLVQGVRPGRRIVDDSKVHDHHAIIPTGKRANPDALDRDTRRVFDLVARRFLGAFHPDAEFAVTEAWIRVGPGGRRAAAGAPPERAAKIEGEAPVLTSAPPMPDRYVARGRVRVQAGWQAVAGIDGGGGRSRSRRRQRDLAAARPRPAIEWALRAGRQADHAAAALHRGHAAGRDGVRRQGDRRRGAAAGDEGLRPGHAGDPRRGDRDAAQARLHRARAPEPAPDRDRHRADRGAAGRGAGIAGAHRILGGAARPGRAR